MIATVAVCLDCGVRGAPVVGMAVPCRASVDGMHRNMKRMLATQVDVDRAWFILRSSVLTSQDSYDELAPKLRKIEAAIAAAKGETMYIYKVSVEIKSPVELYADSFLQEIITEGQKVQAEVEDVASITVLGTIDDYEEDD